MRSVSVAIGFLALGATSWLNAQSQPACSSSTSQQQSLKAWVTWLATAPASDSGVVAQRSYLHIPPVSAGQVTVVTAAATCDSLRTAYAQALGVSSASSLSLIVIKAESVYVVNDPSRRAGEWVLSNVFNLQFERLQGFLY